MGADKELGQRDLGETYRLTLGKHEVATSLSHPALAPSARQMPCACADGLCRAQLIPSRHSLWLRLRRYLIVFDPLTFVLKVPVAVEMALEGAKKGECACVYQTASLSDSTCLVGAFER